MYCFSSFSFLFRFKLEPYENPLGPPDLSVLDDAADVPSLMPEVDIASPASAFDASVVVTASPPFRAGPVAPAIPVRPLLDLARGRLDEEGAVEIGAWLPTAGYIGVGFFVACALCGLAVLAVFFWRRYQRQR